ncbi:hypothetical protein GCM10028825_06180 [Spirosoma agri]
MSTEQVKGTRTGETLNERLKRAYKGVSPNLRQIAKADFAAFHRIHPDTFIKKCNGACVATEQECEWMEDWRPKPVQA